MREKQMRPRQTIRVPFSAAERDLLIEFDYPVGDLTDLLKQASARNGVVVVRMDSFELESLLGFVAGEANHTDEPGLERRLDEIFERLDAI